MDRYRSLCDSGNQLGSPRFSGTCGRMTDAAHIVAVQIIKRRDPVHHFAFEVLGFFGFGGGGPSAMPAAYFGPKPASCISLVDASSIVASSFAMNAALDRPGLIAGRNSITAMPGLR